MSLVIVETDTGEEYEIVLCQNCKWWCTVFERNKAECGMCNVHKQLATTKADDFCSRGEKKDATD